MVEGESVSCMQELEKAVTGRFEEGYKYGRHSELAYPNVRPPSLHRRRPGNCFGRYMASVRLLERSMRLRKNGKENLFSDSPQQWDSWTA